MRKILLALLSLTLLLTVVGCGKEESTEPAGEVDSPEEVEQEEAGDYTFDGKVVELDDIKIEITETKVIPVGEVGNEYGEKPVFAIWYDTTNKSDKEIDPLVWIDVFHAVQDNDPNAINKLEVGALPDDAHLDSQMEVIKKDGTVNNSIAYELDDEETPVTIIAEREYEEIGRHDFDIK